jgi:hypothetical protein
LRGIVERARDLEPRAKEGVLMHFPRKGWRLALSAALTAFAVSVTFAGPAFAAAEPGEWGSWGPETVNNHNMQVASQGTLSEARNNGNLLEVWRGATNNQVWMSFNNGNAFTIGNTATYVSPTVVPWGPDKFMVFHTGTDGNIYYTAVYGDGSNEGEWIDVQYQTTNMPVSVTQLGPGSYDLYMVYRGAGNDQRVWGTLMDSGEGEFEPAENIGGGYSYSAPSVAWNNNAGTLNVVVRGDDGEVWMIDGWSRDWSPWNPQGGNTIDTPHIAVTTGGTMLVDYLDTNYNVQYRVYDMEGNSPLGWLPDTTGYQSHYPVQLAAYGYAIYALLTGLDGLVWYKQAYNNNN